jgi:hypothetical protein
MCNNMGRQIICDWRGVAGEGEPGEKGVGGGGARGFEPGQSKARENEVVIQESYWGARRRFRLVTRQCNEWLHVT